MAANPTALAQPLVVRNPATGEIVGEVPIATRDDVRAAVARARGAADAWRALGAERRLARLLAAADAVDAAAEELADLVTAEMGKPRRSALAEARAVAEGMREAREWRAALDPVERREDGLVTRVVRDPLGVVAVITPWNFPVAMPEAMLTPALLAGNTCVWKPSELTPLSGARLHRAWSSALPAGVLELVQGADQVGEALVAADVQMVAFVGSQAAGKAIMQSAGRDLKRLVLELGGKDPMVVLEDADLEKAADFAVTGSFRNAGQVCVSVERIYVHDAVAERFEQMVLERAQGWRVGPGTRDDVDMGPMVSDEQRAHVLAQIEDARRHGARVLLGGHALPGAGHFVEPTVVTGVTDDMALMREETFGPVAAIQRVRDEDEAIAKANTGSYGLGATLWAGDPERGCALAARLDAGMVGVNRGIGGASGTPWVGAKQSGFGFTGGPEGLLQFTQTRKITFEAT